MTASIISTLAGADTFIYLVYFAPLALIYLVVAIEFSQRSRGAAIQALDELRIVIREVPYKYRVVALEGKVYRIARSSFGAEATTATIHYSEQEECSRDHSLVSEKFDNVLRKESGEIKYNYMASSSCALPRDPASTTNANGGKSPKDASINTTASQRPKTVTTIDTNNSKILHSNSKTSDSHSSATQEDHRRYEDGHKAKEFLDLPSEIRNVVYELVSAPLANTQPCLRDKSGYDIQIDATTKFFLSRLSQTCRLIREEYMACLFAKHEVTFSSLEYARKWQVTIDKRFTSLVKRFTIESRLLIAKDLTWRLGDYRRYGPTPPRYLTVDLHAELWTYAGTTHLKYVFFCSDEFKLCAQSMYMVKRILTAAPFSSDYFTFDNFLEMTDMISKLRLHGHQDRTANSKGMVKLLFHPSFAVNDEGLRGGKETKLEVGEDHFYFPMKD